MTARDDLALVLELACTVEDRTREEDRALVAVALKLDVERGAFVVTNKDPQPPRYVEMVDRPLNGAQATTYLRLTAKWKPCAECGVPLGAHGGKR